MAAPLSPAELADLRRYCGYPVPGLDAPADVQAGASRLDVAVLALSDPGRGILRRVYLIPLSAMERALNEAVDGLDIKKAAVYERNLGELAERDALFTATRARLCGFLGVPVGPGASPAPGLGSASFVPAIFAV